MSLTGIGVLLMGIAFLVGSIFLARTLNNLSKVLSGVDKTVERLPDQLDDVMKETGQLLNHSNDTLADVNKKIAALSPLFYILGDIGESSRKLSSSLVDVTMAMKKDTNEGKDMTRRQDLGGLYGALALGYYFKEKRKALKEIDKEEISA
ncbi:MULTISPECIES: DUF948 domain-containing protein [Thalassobacillus]|uniref:DUF948 domain-containing protein n=1 Tax=Thalassobacillus TaxID=331971 RepID=UPI000A1CD536|nr:DUF948 domain-containing protein [Thalassobacillus devorans]